MSHNSLSETLDHFDGNPLLGTLDDAVTLAGENFEMMQFLCSF